MRNIHVIPTEKPSRLWMTKLGNLARCHDTQPIKESLGNNINIYITSDEEIKEGDWMIRGNEQPIKVTKDFFWDFGVRYYKIILTTDQDLIKDGVQAIDDEFLEWFVKNPSCESVEVLTDAYTMQEIFELKLQNGVFKYKIIIPKEEPKQETLDEAFKKYWSYSPFTKYSEPIIVGKELFENGAKWQAERMYSEEEVLEILCKSHNAENTSIKANMLNKWFENFKKK
jgi:hypothetical protein